MPEEAVILTADLKLQRPTTAERQIRDIERSLFKGTGRTAEPLGRLTGKVSEFDKSLEAANARVIAFGASASVIAGITTAMQAMVTQTIKVEKTLLDINVLLGQSSSGLEKFSDSLFDVAKKTGQSFFDVAEAAKEFSRQGLGVQETLARTSDAMILARLTGLDFTKSVEQLTASVNQFSKEALTTADVVNTLANVDAKFAVSAKDLSEGLSRAGSVAQDAGASFNELIALITAVQQRTARGGAVIANGLKTIFTRVQRSDTLDSLEELGIGVRDVQGNTLPVIQILGELSKKYDTLSSAQKAFTSELVGGGYQINIVKSLFDDLGRPVSEYSKALKVANQSTDEAYQRNELLNKSLASLANEAGQNLTKLAVTFGSLTFEPALKRVFSLINGLGSGEGGQFKEVGAKIGTGILSGIGEFIGGPGLVYLIALAGKLFTKFGKFAKDSIGEVLSLGTPNAKILDTQKGIVDLLRSDIEARKIIESTVTSQIQKEQQLVALIKERVALDASSKNAQIGLARSLVSQGVVYKPSTGTFKTKAGGHMPLPISSIPREAIANEVAGAKQAGYQISPQNVRAMRATIDGKQTTVVYNNKEKVIHDFMGSGEPAIIPPTGRIANYPNGFLRLGNFESDSKHFQQIFKSADLAKQFLTEKIGISERKLLPILFSPNKPRSSNLGEYTSGKGIDVYYDSIIKSGKDRFFERVKGGEPYISEREIIGNKFGSNILHESFHYGFDKNQKAALKFFEENSDNLLMPSTKSIAMRFLENIGGKSLAKYYSSYAQEEVMARQFPRIFGFKNSAGGQIPQIRNYSGGGKFTKDSFGGFEFDHALGGGLIDIDGEEASIAAFDTKKPGKGNSAKVYKAMLSGLKERGIKTVSGSLIPQYLNVPRDNSPKSQLLAKYPQLIRSRLGKSNILAGEYGQIEVSNTDVDKNPSKLLAFAQRNQNLELITTLAGGYLRGFHSTKKGNNFNTFKKGGLGFHFASDEEGANSFGELNFGSQNFQTKGYNLNIKNPLEIKDLGHFSNLGAVLPKLFLQGVLDKNEFNELALKAGIPTDPYFDPDDDIQRDSKGRFVKKFDYDATNRYSSFQPLRKILRKKGYDGLKYNARDAGGTSYVAFYPNQIKNKDNENPNFAKRSVFASGGYINAALGFPLQSSSKKDLLEIANYIGLPITESYKQMSAKDFAKVIDKSKQYRSLISQERRLEEKAGRAVSGIPLPAGETVAGLATTRGFRAQARLFEQIDNPRPLTQQQRVLKGNLERLPTYARSGTIQRRREQLKNQTSIAGVLRVTPENPNRGEIATKVDAKNIQRFVDRYTAPKPGLQYPVPIGPARPTPQEEEEVIRRQALERARESRSKASRVVTPDEIAQQVALYSAPKAGIQYSAPIGPQPYSRESAEAEYQKNLFERRTREQRNAPKINFIDGNAVKLKSFSDYSNYSGTVFKPKEKMFSGVRESLSRLNSGFEKFTGFASDARGTSDEKRARFSQRAFGASFIAPMLGAGVATAFGGDDPTDQRFNRAAQGVGSWIGTGAAVGATIGGPYGAVIGGVIGAFGSLKSVLDNLTPSLEDLNEKVKKDSEEREKGIAALGAYSQVIQELESSSLTDEQRRALEKKANIAASSLSSEERIALANSTDRVATSQDLLAKRSNERDVSSARLSLPVILKKLEEDNFKKEGLGSSKVLNALLDASSADFSKIDLKDLEYGVKDAADLQRGFASRGINAGVDTVEGILSKVGVSPEDLAAFRKAPASEQNELARSVIARLLPEIKNRLTPLADAKKTAAIQNNIGDIQADIKNSQAKLLANFEVKNLKESNVSALSFQRKASELDRRAATIDFLSPQLSDRAKISVGGRLELDKARLEEQRASEAIRRESSSSKLSSLSSIQNFLASADKKILGGIGENNLDYVRRIQTAGPGEEMSAVDSLLAIGRELDKENASAETKEFLKSLNAIANEQLVSLEKIDNLTKEQLDFQKAQLKATEEEIRSRAKAQEIRGAYNEFMKDFSPSAAGRGQLSFSEIAAGAEERARRGLFDSDINRRTNEQIALKNLSGKDKYALTSSIRERNIQSVELQARGIEQEFDSGGLLRKGYVENLDEGPMKQQLLALRKQKEAQLASLNEARGGYFIRQQFSASASPFLSNLSAGLYSNGRSAINPEVGASIAEQLQSGQFGGAISRLQKLAPSLNAAGRQELNTLIPTLQAGQIQLDANKTRAANEAQIKAGGGERVKVFIDGLSPEAAAAIKGEENKDVKKLSPTVNTTVNINGGAGQTSQTTAEATSKNVTSAIVEFLTKNYGFAVPPQAVA